MGAEWKQGAPFVPLEVRRPPLVKHFRKIPRQILTIYEFTTSSDFELRTYVFVKYKTLLIWVQVVEASMEEFNLKIFNIWW